MLEIRDVPFVIATALLVPPSHGQGGGQLSWPVNFLK